MQNGLQQEDYKGGYVQVQRNSQTVLTLSVRLIIILLQLWTDTPEKNHLL